MNFHDLRRAAEVQGHDTNCDVNDHWQDKPCNCGHVVWLTTLDAAEAHLREMAEREDDSIGFRGLQQELAAFLNPPDDE